MHAKQQPAESTSTGTARRPVPETAPPDDIAPYRRRGSLGQTRRAMPV